MIFVDSNVFVLALRYPRDANADDNQRFLDALRARGDRVTSVANVLETCGVLSFNLNMRQLLSLNAHFARRCRCSRVSDRQRDPGDYQPVAALYRSAHELR